MNPTESRKLRADELADQLRAVRTRAGLSGKDLAAATGWQTSKVSKLENTRQMPTTDDIATWVRACGAEPDTAERLQQLLHEALAEHRDWRRRMRRGQAAVQASYNKLVAESTTISHFETVWVPGLLQTPEYARRALTEMVELHGLDIDDVDAAVATRLQRQHLLYDTAKHFEFLLWEPVLRTPICGMEAMRGQLDRLQTAIGLSNVRLGILPLDTPLRTTPQNAVQLYDEVAVVETFLGESEYRGSEAATYRAAVDHMWQEAATGNDARQLLVNAANALKPPA